MSNRWQLALLGNLRDSVVWYSTYQGRRVECHWRKNDPGSITFLMFDRSVEPMKVITVYTIGVNIPKQLAKFKTLNIEGPLCRWPKEEEEKNHVD